MRRPFDKAVDDCAHGPCRRRRSILVTFTDGFKARYCDKHGELVTRSPVLTRMEDGKVRR